MDNATLNRLDATGRSRRQVGLNYALSCARTTKQMYIRDHPDVEHAYIDEAMRVLEHLITEEERRINYEVRRKAQWQAEQAREEEPQ